MSTEIRPGEIEFNQGTLYCLHSDRTITKHRESVSIANGLAWSSDHKTMYYIDSLTFGVDAYDYDVNTGEISKYFI